MFGSICKRAKFKTKYIGLILSVAAVVVSERGFHKISECSENLFVEVDPQNSDA